MGRGEKRPIGRKGKQGKTKGGGGKSGQTTQESQGKNDHSHLAASSSGNLWNANRGNSRGNHTDNWQDKQWKDEQWCEYYNAKKSRQER